MTVPTPPPRGRAVRRVVFVAPSAFTLGNLFFGIWAIVSASRGNFLWAGWFVVFAGVLDTLDGRVARLSKTNSRFGAELDSLVDIVSFGVAPAMIMYFLEFQSAGRFAWVVCYIYVVATSLRLARFNVMVGSTPTGWFTGLPSPAAGLALATWYPFSQTSVSRTALAWLELEHQELVLLMILLSVLMVSGVKYPKWPRVGFRTAGGIFALVLHVVIVGGAILVPSSFLFPFLLGYAVFGILRFVVFSLFDRPDRFRLRGGGSGEPREGTHQ
ncbi:MAG TPA: CDP-diacylglycerol--serine O-phosphatidyltransferase [Gemmatimonadales bacterium]